MNNQLKLIDVVPREQQITTKDEFLHSVGDSILQDRINLVGPQKLLTEEYLYLLTDIPAGKAREYVEKYGLSELSKIADAMDISNEQRMKLQLLFEVCRRINSSVKTGIKITSPDIAAKLFERIRYQTVEILMVAFCDARNCLIGNPVEVSIGTTTENLVPYKTIMRLAINLNASGVIISHNHPSIGSGGTSVTSASGEDIKSSKRLRDGLRLFQIKLLDHIIISGSGNGSGFLSMKEEGLL